jgi:hypothetical protein
VGKGNSKTILTKTPNQQPEVHITYKHEQYLRMLQDKKLRESQEFEPNEAPSIQTGGLRFFYDNGCPSNEAACALPPRVSIPSPTALFAGKVF